VPLGGPHHRAYPEKVQRRSAVLTVLLIAAVVVLVDQLTKAWAISSLGDAPPVEVVGRWLRWVYVTNSGAAFSLGNGNAWLFTLIAAGLIAAVLFFMTRVTNVWWAVSLGMILGRGLGNFIDRMVREPGIGRGHVVDFIAVPNWPVFNVADMAVVGGAALAMILSVRGIDYRDRNLDKDSAMQNTVPQ